MSRIDHRGWYHYNEATRHLWIVPPKCGSTSFTVATPHLRAYRGISAGDVPSEVYMVVRHPFDRIVSALTTLGKPLTTKAVLQLRDEQHVRPYWKWLGDTRKLDGIVRLSHMAGLSSYPHLNRGQHPSWHDTPIDWRVVYPTYARDFLLCHEWSHDPEVTSQKTRAWSPQTAASTGWSLLQKIPKWVFGSRELKATTRQLTPSEAISALGGPLQTALEK